jgi:hypothetical protein
VVRTKHQLNIVNSGIALATLATLAGERLDQIEAEAEAAKPTPKPKRKSA